MLQLPVIFSTVKIQIMRNPQRLALIMALMVTGALWWLHGQGSVSGRATIYSGAIENLPVDAGNGSLAVITDGADLSDTRSGGSTFEVLAIFDGAAKVWNPVTTIPAHGAVHSGLGATANISGTPVALGGTFNLSGRESLFDNPLDGRLRYVGLTPRTFGSTVHFSFTANVNNRVISLMVSKNGTIIPDAEITRKTGAGADVGAMSTGYLVTLNTDDYLEVFVDSDGGNPTITTEHLTLMAWVVD